MAQFQRLPLLEDVAALVSCTAVSRRLETTAVVGVQHLLETTGTLVETLLGLGVRSESVFLLGKAYSTSRTVLARLRDLGVEVSGGRPPDSPGTFAETFAEDVEELWARAVETLSRGGCDRIVVVDDGGHCLRVASRHGTRVLPALGVEQTTSGLSTIKAAGTVPVIEVASSAAKKILESPMISRAVLRRLPSLASVRACGVAGVGNIGRAVASHLVQNGKQVFLYDRNLTIARDFPGAHWCEDLEEFVNRSELIFGCTGDDLFRKSTALDWIDSDRTLVSCSSEDREFKSVLERGSGAAIQANASSFSTLTLEYPRARVRILRGGFPFNFDGTLESVPAGEIQLTRSLLLGAVLQAVLSDDNQIATMPRSRMLSPSLQRWAARQWLERNQSAAGEFADEIVRGFDSLTWIGSNSGGAPEVSPWYENWFD